MGEASLAEATTTAEQETVAHGVGISAWKLVWIALALTFLPPLIGIPIYLKWAAQVPPYTPPQSTWTPTPNGYDRFLAAGKQLNQSDLRTLHSKQALGRGEVRRLLATYPDALEAVRSGMRMECRVPFFGTYSRPLPELIHFRGLGRLLVVEGHQEETAGRLDSALRHYLQALRFGASVQPGGGFAYAATGTLIERRALGALLAVSDRLDPHLARELLRELFELEKKQSRPVEAALTQKELGTAGLHELLLTKDPLQTVADLDGKVAGEPQIGEWERWRFRLTPKARILANWRTYSDQVTQGFQQPYYERKAAPQVPPDPIHQSMLADSRAWLEFPGWELRDAMMRTLQVRLAMRLYQRETGKEAPSLTALVPRYLPVVPADPFAPKPLIFRREGKRTLVYSRGMDGDDDGGKPYNLSAGVKSDGDAVGSGMALP